MSHEIRTPINAIMGTTEMILRSNSKEEVMSMAKDIKGAGNQLSSIISGILDFSKIESGEFETVEVNYDTASCICEVIKGIAPRIEKKGIEFITDISETIPKGLRGDATHVRQILNNLLDNAWKYTEKGQIILTIESKEIEESNSEVLIYFMVEDTGCGIKEKAIPSIFDSFQRLELRKHVDIQGTGLGLAISKKLVESMGGEISVESVYGEGTQFTFFVKQRIWDPAPMGKLMQQKAEKEGVAAIIITRQCSDELSAALAETSIPLVCIGIRDEHFKTRQRPTVYVHNDNSAIGDIGARHFASLGRFCSYGFVLSDDDVCSRIAASAVNTPACVFHTSPSSNPKTNISKLSEWIKSLPKPAAVMASCDQRAIEVLSACERAHISVPDAVAVLGVDNDEFLCAHASPPLSSVMPGHREMGRIAAETLGKLRSRKSIARRCSVVIVPPCKVVERESTHRRPPSAILVERTRNFIREHATNGIDVQAVVSHLGVSRRLVEKRWREATGGTIRSAIEEAISETVSPINSNPFLMLLEISIIVPP